MSLLLQALVGVTFTACASARTLTLYLGNTDAQPPAVVREMKAETARLLKPAGISLEWRSLEMRRADEQNERLAVVRLGGKCGYRRGPLPAPGAPLAFTHTANERILPFTDIHCEAIAAIVSAQPATLVPARKDQLMGRAVARVLAHELYHVLGQTRHHAGAGVGKACFHYRDLVEDDFRFDTSSLALLRRDFDRSPNPPATEFEVLDEAAVTER